MRPIAWAGCELGSGASSVVSPGPSQALSLATRPLIADFRGVVAVVASLAFAAVVVRWVIPKYHRIRPISRTPPAVPSISGKRSISG